MKKAVELSKEISERYGAKPYGFSFVTYREADPVKDEKGNELKVEPKRVAWSPGTVFLGGVVETYDEVMKRNDPGEQTLRINMSGVCGQSSPTRTRTKPCGHSNWMMWSWMRAEPLPLVVKTTRNTTKRKAKNIKNSSKQSD